MQQLITPQEVIQIAFTADSFSSPDLIRASKITIAQEHFLRPRLGDTLYDELGEDSYAQFLEDYIKAPLAYYVRYGLLDELSISVDPSGVIQRVGGTTTTSSVKETQNTKTTSATEKEDYTEVKSTDQTTTTNETLSSTTTQNYERSLLVDGNQEKWDPSPYAHSSVETSSYTSEGESTNDLSIEKEQQDETTAETQVDDITVSTQSENQQTNSSTVEDDYSAADNQQEESSDYTPASMQQVQSLKMKAISDANALMRVALRYIRTHADEFPDYEAASRFYF